MMTENPKNEIADLNPDFLTTLKNERALWLDKHVVEKVKGDDAITACDNYIQINSSPLNGTLPTKIKKGALYQLFKDSSALRSSEADILALKIHYGVTESNTICFCYQPIALNLKDELHDAEAQKHGIFLIIAEGPIYNYSSSVFQKITELELHSERYRTGVKIFRYEGINDFNSFREGDAKSAIFSFQEIFALLHDNDDSEELNIFNCIKRVHKTKNKFEIKHSLLLASLKFGPLDTTEMFLKNLSEGNTVELSPFIIPIEFKGLYANLAHLCPPNCARFLYPLED